MTKAPYFLSENWYFLLISYILNHLFYEVMPPVISENPSYGGNYIEIQHFEEVA